jgi:hypothetical protein
MAGKWIKKNTVTAIGTPPPLPPRPLVDEVHRAMEWQRGAEAEAQAATDLGDSSVWAPHTRARPS